MADPVTMAVVGGSIGAMTNKKDPLKGALLGAAGGYGGATLMGAGGLAGAGSSSALTSAAGTGGSMTAVPAFGGNAFQIGANAVPSAGIFSGGGTAALGGISPVTAAGPSTGLIPSSLAQPTFMETLGGGLKDIQQFTQQNPVLTQMGMQTAQQMMQQPEVQMAPAGQVSRGQIQGGDYMSLLNPQQGSVIRPQPISLLG